MCEDKKHLFSRYIHSGKRKTREKLQLLNTFIIVLSLSFIVGSSLSVDKWLSEVDGQTFEDWQKRSIRVVTKRPEWKKIEARAVFLQEKYFKKWYDKTLRRQAPLSLDMTSSSSWLKRVLFNPSSRMGDCRFRSAISDAARPA